MLNSRPVKKLFLSFLVFVQVCTPALAIEEIEAIEIPTTIFENVDTEQLQQPQTVQFFLGAPSNQLPAESTLDAEFLYQKLLDRMNSDFRIVDHIVKISTILMLLSVFFFLVALTIAYFVFYKKIKTQASELAEFTKNKTEEIKKECEMQGHNVQSIVDSQQQVLGELKETAAKKLEQKEKPE